MNVAYGASPYICYLCDCNAVIADNRSSLGYKTWYIALSPAAYTIHVMTADATSVYFYYSLSVVSSELLSIQPEEIS